MDLVNHLDGRLLFAVPKKGRLQATILDLLHGSDIQFRRKDRLDIALVTNLPIALVFLPAADIPMFVAEGQVDLGITGWDQVAEYEAGTPATATTGVEKVMDLDFAKVALQVQTPENGSLADPRSLIGKRIATSYENLTRQYFWRLENEHGSMANGVSTGSASNLRTKIIYQGGSVEASCALGVADGVVDLVESGETMRACGLRAIETIAESTAFLIKSKHPSNPALVDLLASRIRGVITAQSYVLCVYNVRRDNLKAAEKITPGKRAPTVTSLEDRDWVAVSVMVLRSKVATIMDELSAIGAEDILTFKLQNSRTA